MMKKFGKILIPVLVLLVLLLVPVVPSFSKAGPVFKPAVAEAQADSANDLVSKFADACSATSPSTWFTSCLATALYYGLFQTSAWFLAMTGRIFDVSLFFSIDSATYTGTLGNFVNKGWGLTRDLANIAFIFILLYIAFQIILNIKAAEAKALIAKVVIIALLINFSLFFVHVLVDASNILSRVFYNSMSATADVPGFGKPSGAGDKTLSAALVSKYNPQNFLEFKPDELRLGGGQTVSTTAAANQQAGYFMILVLIATALNVFTMIIFLTVSLLFIARVVGLWLVMIFAPFAFISYLVPKVEGVSTSLGYQTWWKNVISYALMVPIFLFFFYLIIMFLSLIKLTDIFNSPDQSTIIKMLAVVFPFIVIYILMTQARDIAKKLSGEIGAAFIKGAGMVASAALGAGAFAGRAFIGGGAFRLLEAGRGRVPPGGAPRAPGEGAPPGGAPPMPPEFGRAMRTLLRTGPVSPTGERRKEETPPGGAPPTEEVRAPVILGPTGRPAREELGLRETPEEREKRVKEKMAGLRQRVVAKQEAIKTLWQTTVGTMQKYKDNKPLGDDTAKTAANDGAARNRGNEAKKSGWDKFKQGAGAVGGWFNPIPNRDKIGERSFSGGVESAKFGLLRYLSKHSFDFRGSKLAGFFEDMSGIKLGKPAGKGGFLAMREKKMEKELKWADDVSRLSMRELKELHRMNLTLAQMKAAQVQGREFKDETGAVYSGGNLDAKIVDFEKQYKAEDDRTKNVRASRVANAADIVARGRGWQGFNAITDHIYFQSSFRSEAAEKIIKGQFETATTKMMKKLQEMLEKEDKETTEEIKKTLEEEVKKPAAPATK